jgi:hypothetical protein
LYKALGPTLKPATFTQNLAENKFLNMEPTSAVSAPQANAPESNAPTAPPGAAPSEVPQAAAHQAEVKVQPAEATMQKLQNLNDQSRPQVVTASQLDLGAIRRRLESSGYGVNANGGGIGGGNWAPVLMVVNSSDAPATKVQIAQFLNNSTGISWNVIPQDADWKSNATTLPTGGAVAGGAAQSPLKYSLKALDTSGNVAAETAEATTQPSSDVFYVARGLTAEQADALRQTLIVPQNGPEVQVTMQSAQPLMQLALTPATTEPSVKTDKEVNVMGVEALAATATSQPSVSANGAADRLATPTTAPAVGMSVNRWQTLQTVDAVIVLEQSPTSVLTPGPSTRADSLATKSELAPATQPSTQP